MVRPETNVRLTDVLGDEVFQRLGNTGSELLADLLSRFHQSLGCPFEVFPTATPSSQILVSAGVYSLPDGRRLASLRGGVLPAFSAGTIDLAAGTISMGTSSTFAPIVLTAGQFVRTAVQYCFATNAFGITYGTPASTLAAATMPKVTPDFVPVCILELASSSVDGSLQPVTSANIVGILDGADYQAAPTEEIQAITGSPQSVFALAVIQAPVTTPSRLTVFVNGIRQISGADYAITNATTVTFLYNVRVNATVLFRVG